MQDFINRLYRNHSNIYKGILFVVAVVLVVYFFPKGGQFKFEFQKGKPWQYDNLYAPFDFAIQKSAEDIEAEKTAIIEDSKFYLERKTEIETQVFENINRAIWKGRDSLGIRDSIVFKRFTDRVAFRLNAIYNKGYYDPSVRNRVKDTTVTVMVRNGNQLQERHFFELYNDRKILEKVSDEFDLRINRNYRYLQDLVLANLKPSLLFDDVTTEKILQEELSTIAYTTGMVSKDELIILRGDIVEGRILDELSSLKAEYESQVWSQQNYIYIFLGYTVLVCIVFAMMLAFIRAYRVHVFENNTMVTFIFVNMVLIILLTTVIINYNPDYIYAVPFVFYPLY